MSEAPAEKPKRSAPWKGRRKVSDPKSKPFPIRLTPDQFEQISATAREAGLSAGAFARAVLLGSPGPRAVRKPPVEKAELARILGELGRINSQLSRIDKTDSEPQARDRAEDLSACRRDLSTTRDAIMRALGREP